MRLADRQGRLQDQGNQGGKADLVLLLHVIAAPTKGEELPWKGGSLCCKHHASRCFPGQSYWCRSSIPWTLPACSCRCRQGAASELTRGSAALGRRMASELELASRKGIQLWDFSSSLFLSPVNRCSGSSGGGHAAQLHGAGGDNLGDTRRNYPMCQTDLCGDAGGTVCNKGGKVHRKKTQLAPQQRWELWSVSLIAFTTRCRTTHFLVPLFETHPVCFPCHLRTVFLESHTGNLPGQVPQRRWFVL